MRSLKPAVKGMYLRGSSWWLRYTPGPGLPQKRESLGTEIETVATIKALAILQKAPLEEVDEFHVELGRYLGERVRQKLLSEQGAKNRQWIFDRFTSSFGIKKLSDITTAVVEKWTAILRQGEKGKSDGTGKRKGISEGTVASYVFHLRAFFEWLIKKNRVRENPAAQIELGAVELVVKKTFVPSETVRVLIEGAQNDDMRFILYCGFHAGMRKLEIIEARPDWFHLGSGSRRGFVNVRRTTTFSCKDRDERSIPLSLEFENFLRGYLARLPEGATWVLRPRQTKGQHRYRYDFRVPFATHMRTHGVKCSPHDMRRSFVSNKLIQDSSLIFKLAKWTGDGVKVLQDHYAHLLTNDGDIEKGI